MLNSLRSRRIHYPTHMRFSWRLRVTFGAAEFTPDGDTDQTLTLNTTYTRKPFPTNVRILSGAYIYVVTDPVGTSLSALQLDVGDAANDDELIAAQDAFGAEGTYLYSTAAAAYNTNVPEAAYSPTLRIRPTGCNVDDLTAGAIDIVIPFAPLLVIPAA